MTDLQIQIQQQLDNAKQTDIIQLPQQILDFPLIISKPCTVVGNATTIDVSASNIEYAITITADNVTLSDMVIKNKNEPGFNAVYIKSNQASLERLILNCDLGLLIDQSNNIDLIEVKTSATTGIRIKNSSNIDISACEIYNCSVGLDIVGSSSISGNIDSYQGFGLNIQPNDIIPLTADEEYEFKVDGMLFSFKAVTGMTYQGVIDTINSIIGFNPTYKAEINNNDIIIKTSNTTILLEQKNNSRSLFGDLNITPLLPINNYSYSYVKFGLNIVETAVTNLEKNVVYTFLLDGTEIQFFSPDTDGTTYRELVGLIQSKISPLGYMIDIISGDIIIKKISSPSINLMNGTRFKNLFTVLGATLQKSTLVVESTQKLGLSITPDQLTPLLKSQYTFIANGVEYTVNNIVDNLSYGQLITLLNNNISFKSKFTAYLDNGDIEILTSAPSILLEATKLSVFTTLGTTPPPPQTGSEASRTDRSHRINIIGCFIHNNQIGVRLINANDIFFTGETKVFMNTNIGIWQQPSSYNIKFRGEIYSNTNFGIRNTDKGASNHDIDAMDSWWGDRTGPSMMGQGEGDKISSGVNWKPQRQNGTVPDLTYPKTREYILGMLGYPLVKVEMTDEQIGMCIDRSIYKFMQYRTPEPIYRYIDAKAGNAFTKLPIDMPKENIIEVTYSPNADIFAQLSGSGESFYMTYYMNQGGSSGGSNTFLSDFYVAMSYRETMETTLGLRPTYELVSGKDTDGTYCDYIRFSPIPERSLRVAILYSRPMTEAEVDGVDWVKKYAHAVAKEVLGRIRSKYASVPGPTGDIVTDGSTLLAESQQEIEKLEQQLIDQGQPLAFSVG